MVARWDCLQLKDMIKFRLDILTQFFSHSVGEFPQNTKAI